ncbi:MAG: hypothetical protein GY754_15045, partial [bacterium]|nr:hypothetical protein [bacterium]
MMTRIDLKGVFAPIIFLGLTVFVLTGIIGCENEGAGYDGFVYAEAGDGSIGGDIKPGYYLSTALWNTTNLSVCWENLSTANATERGWIRESVESNWAANSRLQFTGWGQCGTSGANIRIRIEDVGPHTHGLGTALNNRVNGMSLNIIFNNWGCRDSSGNWTACSNFSWFTAARRENWIRSNAIHEFGHAL